jgi:hypothetical protein
MNGVGIPDLVSSASAGGLGVGLCCVTLAAAASCVVLLLFIFSGFLLFSHY